MPTDQLLIRSFSGLRRVLALEALHDDDGDKEGDKVAGGQGKPHAVQPPQRREQQHHGQQEQQLARQRHENADAHLADGLEEIGDRGLIANNGKG